MTPLTVVVPNPGESKLELKRAGYQAWSGPLLSTGPGEPRVITLTALVPVRVETDPAGATVQCDGKEVLAATPGTFEVEEGRHRLTANLEGYLLAEEDHAYNDKERLWKVALAKAAFLDVTSSPAGAQVFVDGKDTGRTTPAERLAVAPGVHEVQAKSGKASSLPKKVKAVVGGRKLVVALKVVDRARVERDKNVARLAKLRTAIEKLERKLDAQREGVIVKDANYLVKLEKQIEELVPGRLARAEARRELRVALEDGAQPQAKIDARVEQHRAGHPARGLRLHLGEQVQARHERPGHPRLHLRADRRPRRVPALAGGL